MSLATELSWISDDEIVAIASQSQDSLAAHVLDVCRARGETVACAESLTGGLLSDSLVRIPGASSSFLGSAVTYSTAMKHALLGVDSGLLNTVGAVHEDVAAEMARGVLSVFSSDIALSTTGVAGPTPQDGQEVGTVFIGVAHAGPRPHAAVFGMVVGSEVIDEVGACSQFTGGRNTLSKREVIRKIAVLAALSRV